MGYKSEVRDWKQGLTLLVKNRLQHLERDIAPPVSLRFRLLAPRRTRIVDAGNFSKIIEDAVFDALGFDDNDTRLVRGPYSGVQSGQKEGLFAIILEEIANLDVFYDKNDLEFFTSVAYERRI
jgi:hypothetical protein